MAATFEDEISVKGVTRSFQVAGGELEVLKGVDLKIKPGTLVMLKGRSGSGKTTLLNIIGGLDLPTMGEVWFEGRPLSNLSDMERTMIRRTRIGFIFQAFALMPLLSAAENVELTLRLAGVKPKLWKERVEETLALVGLEKRMKHKPYELSGGEQQRVAIARALVHRPRLVLADEPTAELDSKRSLQMIQMFKSLIVREGVTLLMTTHDPALLEVADEIYEMVDGKVQKI
ncbi:MAG: ABC transporter ATP-binding protein [Thermicanus sp.]|nr:ABC transporter ATP-binding protein [Thermicanus sp.]